MQMKQSRHCLSDASIYVLRTSVCHQREDLPKALVKLV